MESRKTLVAALIVAGGLVAGCHPKQSATPAASTSTLSSADQATIAQLQRNYRASHPGTEVGVVNAAIPERHVISVTGIPLDRIRVGDVVTIMSGGESGAVPAVVYAKADGYVQLRYQPLPAGQAPPSSGNLAVWSPGGAAVPPDAIAPPGETRAPLAPAGETLAPARSPAPMPPPATMPMTDVAPATRPAVQQEAPPPSTVTPAPVRPAPTAPTSSPTTMPMMPLELAPLVPPATRPSTPDLNK